MEYDPTLAALLAQPWSNNVCRGYVIYAMENCGFAPEDIQRVVAELYEVFDCRGAGRGRGALSGQPLLSSRQIVPR